MATSKRRKIFIPFADHDEKRRGTPVIRELLRIAFERAEMGVANKEPLPPSFVALFGAGAAINTRVTQGAPDSFAFASEGGALRMREQALLKFLEAQGGASLPNTERLKDSMVSGISCIVSLPNPADERTAAAAPERKPGRR